MATPTKALLLVESLKQDVYIFKHLLHNNTSIEIDSINTSIKFDKVSGAIEPTNLEFVLKQYKTALINGNYEKLGLILDIDNHTLEKRLASILKAFQNVFPEYCGTFNPQEAGTFESIDFDGSSVQFACHFIGVYNDESSLKGELEHLLIELMDIETAPYALQVNQCMKHALQDPSIRAQLKDKVLC